MMLGQQVDHFLIKNLLGSGGMGTVYEAVDLQLGRRVAIKILSKQSVADKALVLRPRSQLY
jgi:serine/threonine protein kinase